MKGIVLLFAMLTLAPYLDMTTAISDPDEVCRQPGDPGNALQKWHWDHKDHACKEFTYGGAGGNENRFDSKEECDKRCGGLQKSGRAFPSNKG